MDISPHQQQCWNWVAITRQSTVIGASWLLGMTLDFAIARKHPRCTPLVFDGVSHDTGDSLLYFSDGMIVIDAPLPIMKVIGQPFTFSLILTKLIWSLHVAFSFYHVFFASSKHWHVVLRSTSPLHIHLLYCHSIMMLKILWKMNLVTISNGGGSFRNAAALYVALLFAATGELQFLEDLLSCADCHQRPPWSFSHGPAAS